MTSNGKSEESLPPPIGPAADLLLEAWRESLGEVLATEREQMRR
jgi:hypothetical protein